MIATEERDSILSLIKYFSPWWIIVDCGSNKLQWSEALMEYRDGSTEAGKYTVYSIEPNDKLRTYQQVKYDYNENIKYISQAAYIESDFRLDFYYWENKNNGLSSLLDNEKWKQELGEFRKHKIVHTLALDDLKTEGEIDIIKIDVEGAEELVLKGCARLLKEKRVKFIQVEYSEHYKIIDAKFTDLIDYVEQFGYSAWSWDGKYWNKISKEDFVEDYRLENFILTYKKIGLGSRDYVDLQYTQDWNSEFIKNTKGLGKFDLALEIGCFEGISSNHICDSLLNENGRLICVDPLIDGVYLEGHKDNHIFVGQYDRFINNTKDQPVELLRMKSDEAWPLLQEYRPQFIYIDGDHRENSVYNDGVNAFKILTINGYILFDDYGQDISTQRGIDGFIEKGGDRIEVVLKDYQVLVKKIRN